MTSMVPYPIIYLFHVGLRRNMSECEVKEKSETYVIATVCRKIFATEKLRESLPFQAQLVLIVIA